MTVQTLLSKQNLCTDDNLLTPSDLLRTIPADRLPCFNKTKQKQVFQQVRFHQWNIVTRRVETDSNVLLQVSETNRPFTTKCCWFSGSS